MYQKTILDRYFCKKIILSLENFRKNGSKISFLYYYNGRIHRFENTCSRAKTYVILTSLNHVCIPTHVSVDDVNFCDGLECVHVKYKSRASTARELPN